MLRLSSPRFSQNDDGHIRHDVTGQGRVELFLTGLDAAKRYR